MENIGSASGVFGVMDLTKMTEKCVRASLGRDMGEGRLGAWSVQLSSWKLALLMFRKAALFQAVRLEVLELRHRGMAFA